MTELRRGLSSSGLTPARYVFADSQLAMKRHELATADFVKAADALTNESFHGGIHLAICEGLADMDPFIGNHAPVFFTYTFYGHLYSAQMYANKLFDTHSGAFPVSKFLEMARLRSSNFQRASKKEVLAYIAEAEAAISELMPTIKVLRRRRNDFLAHISPSLAFTPEQLRQAKTLTMPEIREVIYGGGKIVNRFLIMWNNSSNQLRETQTDDYKKVVSIVTKHLCEEAKAYDAEFAKYGASKVPRPRNGP